jgi:thymidine kinase
MTVEIGPRQSGKTTRLIESIAEFLENNPDKTALLVSPNDGRRFYKEKVAEICGDCKHRVITSYKMLPPNPNATMKQFVDEFGAMRCDRMVIDPDAYYCSSYYSDVFSDTVHNKAKDILQFYWDMNQPNWDMAPKKHVFKHDF